MSAKLFTTEVTYDLRAPGRDYKPVWDYLRKYDQIHPLDSTWFVLSTKTAAQVRDDLAKLIDTNDRVLCVDVSDCSWASQRLDTAATDWLKKWVSRTPASV